MRFNFTLFILTAFFLSSFSQDTLSIKNSRFKIFDGFSATSNQQIIIRFRCGSSIRDNNKPLFIIDGVLAEEPQLKKLNPDIIESIWILKNSEATALYGYRAANGVVVIITKTANQRTIIVKDMFTREPIPAASIDLIHIGAKRDTIHFVGDSLGRIATNKIVYGKEYKLRVSSVGYKSFIASVNSKIIGKNYSVLLEKSYSDLMPVVVIGYPTIRCRTISCGLEKISRKDLINENTLMKAINIYPNPVLRSQNVNFEFEHQKAGKLTVKLLSMDGKLLGSNHYSIAEGVSRVSYFINPRLSPGLYSVQVTDENTRLLRIEKIIIQ